ncbi:MAG: hypothetical protein ACLU6Y_11480 [Ruminococcus sp.]
MPEVSRLIRWHDLRPTPAPAEVRKAINVVGEDLFPMWMEVQYADNKAKSDYRGARKRQPARPEFEMTWEEIVEKGECVSMKGLAVTGSDLIAAGMKPGKEMGEVLHELLDAGSGGSGSERERNSSEAGFFQPESLSLSARCPVAFGTWPHCILEYRIPPPHKIEGI